MADKIDPDASLASGITTMRESGVTFEMAVQLMVDMDQLAKHVATHAMTGNLYDLKKQPIYLLAAVALGWFRPELMEEETDDD